MSWLDFIIVGTQKGGTTAMSVNLSKHPQIDVDLNRDPLHSEVHFFDKDYFFKDNKPCKISEVPVEAVLFFLTPCSTLITRLHELITTYKDESTLFLYKCRLFFTIKMKTLKTTDTLLNISLDKILHMERLRGDELVGEKTPFLMVHRRFMERIKNSFPDVKLILSLRDPIARAYSQWKMLCSRGSQTDRAEKRTFDKCVREEIARLKSGAPTPANDRFYVYRGLYDVQLKVIYELFNPKQVIVIWAEHTKQDPKREYSKVFDFLGVDRIPIEFELDVHASCTTDECNEQISPVLMKFMKKFYGTRNNVPSSGGTAPRNRRTKRHSMRKKSRQNISVKGIQNAKPTGRVLWSDTWY
jgi:hypothetical protein